MHAVNYSMHILINVFDPVICKTPECAITLFAILQGKVVTF